MARWKAEKPLRGWMILVVSAVFLIADAVFIFGPVQTVSLSELIVVFLITPGVIIWGVILTIRDVKAARRGRNGNDGQ